MKHSGEILPKKSKSGFDSHKIVRLREHEAEHKQLQDEIERHKRMHLDVNTYRPVLKLGILELNIDTYDFKEYSCRKLIATQSWIHVEANRRNTSAFYTAQVQGPFQDASDEAEIHQPESGNWRSVGFKQSF